MTVVWKHPIWSAKWASTRINSWPGKHCVARQRQTGEEYTRKQTLDMTAGTDASRRTPVCRLPTASRRHDPGSEWQRCSPNTAQLSRLIARKKTVQSCHTCSLENRDGKLSRQLVSEPTQTLAIQSTYRNEGANLRPLSNWPITAKLTSGQTLTPLGKS